MKDKPTEWVAISDLMAGVVAVIVLLLIVSVLKNTVAEIERKKEKEQGAVANRKKIKTMLEEMKQSFEKQGASGLASFDLENGKIILRDNVFARSSACITPEAKTAFASVEKEVMSFWGGTGAQVFVEGHTDNVPVGKPVTNFANFCAVYDDNYTLSAARAREARRLLIGSTANANAKNVIVAGYGDSHLIPGIPPDDAKNRRVEVRFTVIDK